MIAKPRLRWAVVAASVAAAPIAEAADAHRIAFSKRLGVEIFAQDVGAGWCGANLLVQVKADDAAIFSRPDFASLIKVVGDKVLPKECPQAARMALTGIDKTSAQVFSGSAGKDAGWAVVAARPATAPVQQAATTAPAAPTAAPAAPSSPSAAAASAPAVAAAPEGAAVAPAPLPASRPDSPLLGDWSGPYVCNNDPYKVTLSIDAVDGKAFKGVVEFAKERQPGWNGRYTVAGYFDSQTRQIQVEAKDWIARPGYTNPLDLNGQVDLAAGKATRQLNCYGRNSGFTLDHVSPIPSVAQHIRGAMVLREKRRGEELSRPRDGRLVGVTPRGEFRLPDCNGFIAWYQSHPPGQRLRILGHDSPGILRLFDDQSSAAFFGTPLYYVNRQTLYELNNHFNNSCGSVRRSNRQLFDAIYQAAGDSQSIDDLVNRRALDETLATLIPDVLGQAGPAKQQMEFLASLADAGRTKEALGEYGARSAWLTAADVNNVVKDAQRYQAQVAKDMIAAAQADLPAVPERIDGLRVIDQRLAEIKAQVGTGEAEALAKYEAAAKERKAAIGNALVDATIAAVRTLPRTMDGLAEADLRASEAEAQLKPVLGEARLMDLRTAVQDFRTETRVAVVKAEMEAVAKAEDTPDGAAILRERRDRVIALVKKGPALPELAAYRTAVDDRIEAIATRNIGVFKSELETLPKEWKGVEAALAMKAEAERRFGGTKAVADYVKVADARAADIRKALAEQAIIDVKGTNPSYKELDQVAAQIDAMATAFESKGGSAEAKRIREAGNSYLAEVLDKNFKQFRIDLASDVDNKGLNGAVTAARTALRLEKQEARYPAFRKYREHAAEQARKQRKTACEKTLDKSGIDDDDDQPVLVGDDVVPLGAFACALGGRGHRVTEFKTPGMFGDKVWKMRVFTKREEWLNLDFESKEVKPDVHALVAIMKDQDGKRESLSMKEWKFLSAMLADPDFAGMLAFDKSLCKSKPGDKEDGNQRIKRILTCS